MSVSHLGSGQELANAARAAALARHDWRQSESSPCCPLSSTCVRAVGSRCFHVLFAVFFHGSAAEYVAAYSFLDMRYFHSSLPFDFMVFAVSKPQCLEPSGLVEPGGD